MSQKISTKDKIAFQRFEIYKKRLQVILKQKNPKKINAVDGLLSKYRGKEHAVYVKVCGKYGIKPKPEWTPNNKQPSNRNKPNNNIRPKSKQSKKKQLVPKPPIQQTKPKSKPLPKKSTPSKFNVKKTNLRQNKMKNNLSKLKNRKSAQKSVIKPVNIKKQIPQIKKNIKIAKQEESEDEYEDDFEDYSDDFETEEPEIKSQSHISTKKQSIVNKEIEMKSNASIKKYNIKSTKTTILFEMRQRTVHETYLKRVGTEIFSRSVQSIYLQNTETQTIKNKMESKGIQYQFCDRNNMKKDLNYDRKRLMEFVRKSSKVMNGLLAYNNNSNNICKQILSEKDMNCNQFLSETIIFKYDLLLKYRSINDIVFSISDNNIIGVAYSKLNDGANSDDEKTDNNRQCIKSNGLICIWDMKQHLYPIYELICDDEINIIQFLPNDYNLIIGGRQNGCIAVWDLNEPNHMHKKYIMDDNNNSLLYVRYPTYMTDSQWNKNHIYPIIDLKFLNNSEFCSVDTNGIINGWAIKQINGKYQNEIVEELKSMDLCCRDIDTIKINQQFTFNINNNMHLQKTHSIQFSGCISVDPSCESKMLFAYQKSVYMIERIGSHIEVIKQYTLKYDVSGINYPNNNVISVAYCRWKKNIFVAGYQNGMICLFNTMESNPIRRFYDINNIECVLSVAWIKTSHDILMYGLFQGGRIRFLDINDNQVTQTYRFEKILPSNDKSHNIHCCKSVNSFIAMSNAPTGHTLSVHRINT